MAGEDLEKAESLSTSPPVYDYGRAETTKPGTKLSRFADSFRRNPNARMVTEAVDAEGKPLPDQPPVEPALSMQLKGRHLQMIAIGGSIGMCLK
jgi:amino acid transporter